MNSTDYTYSEPVVEDVSQSDLLMGRFRSSEGYPYIKLPIVQMFWSMVWT